MSLDATTLYTRYRRVIFGLAYHLTGRDRDAAEDLTQDTFIRALTHAVPADHPDYWLKKVCYNLARDQGRRAAIIRWEPWGPQTPEGIDPQTPDLAFLRQEAQAEAARMLTAALATCTPDQRAALHLTAQGLSQAEIGVALGRPASAVKALVHRARVQVRQAVAG